MLCVQTHSDINYLPRRTVLFIYIAFCIFFGYSPLILVRLHIFRHVTLVEDESLYSDDPPHALPNLSTDVRLSSSLGSAPGETSSSSVAPQGGDDSDDLDHSDQEVIHSEK